MRTLVVGDIHGGLKALEQVLEKVNPSQNDQFIFLGDYVDGWSESAETISFLMAFRKKYPCVFLRGNHDELTYNYIKHGDAPPLWLNHGGRATQKSYEKVPLEAIEDHLSFFQNLMNFHVDSKNRLFVHAGFTNLNGPQHEYYPNLVYWDRTLWEMACSLDKSLPKNHSLYPSRLKLFSEIYIGHTPTTRLGETVPVQQANVWNLDTGAAFKGPLTIMDVDTKEIWQSNPVFELYPAEKGRN
ncbi:MAG: metallophosphoesterase family protein [Flavobacteriaceae bacterium]